MHNTKDVAEGSAAPTGYPFSRSPEEVRVQWMRLYGVPEDEILRSLKDDPPVSISDEESQLDAIISIRESYGSGELFPEVLDFFLGQMQMHSPDMSGQHRWRFRSSGWPMTHCKGPTAVDAVRAAILEIRRERDKSA